MFTLLPVEEIDTVVREHERQPEHRLAQKLLAEEVTLMIHGSKGQSCSPLAHSDMSCRGRSTGCTGSHKRPFWNRLLRPACARYCQISRQ